MLSWFPASFCSPVCVGSAVHDFIISSHELWAIPAEIHRHVSFGLVLVVAWGVQTLVHTTQPSSEWPQHMRRCFTQTVIPIKEQHRLTAGWAQLMHMLLLLVSNQLSQRPKTWGAGFFQVFHTSNFYTFINMTVPEYTFILLSWVWSVLYSK